MFESGDVQKKVEFLREMGFTDRDRGKDEGRQETRLEGGGGVEEKGGGETAPCDSSFLYSSVPAQYNICCNVP